MNKVDILYIVGTGSQNGNAELRYSLRCLSKHGKNVGRVIVCGDVPDFVGRDAVVIRCHDISVNGKHWNMLHKIEEGIKGAGLTGRFLFSSDDHFITKDFDMASWPTYTRGKIYNEEEYASSHGKPCGKYQRSICATRRLLERHGLPIQNIVWHGNMWLDARYMQDVHDLTHSDVQGSVYGYEPMLVYNAFRLLDEHNAELLPLSRDVKARSFDEAINLAETRHVFSTSDKAWENGKLIRWFKKNYPDKSEWEV